MSELDVLVLGGGISGLSIAHCLANAGQHVEVWESSERPGGKINTVVKDGYRLEDAASMVMNFRAEMDGFLTSAHLRSEKISRNPGCQRYVLNNDQLSAVPTSIKGLLTTPLFSNVGKLRMLCEPLIPRGHCKEESVAEFIARRFGTEFLQKLFEPYIAGPLASDIKLAEANSTIPRLTGLEEKFGSLALGALLSKLRRRSGTAGPQVFSFAGGMTTLTQTLASRGGFRIRQNLRADEIWPVGDGWMCRGQSGGLSRTIFARQIVVSTPAHSAANLVDGVDIRLARLLRAIEYAPLKVLHTGFDRADIRHALNGSGFLVPRHSRFSANGCLWMSNLFPDQAPQNQVLFSNYLGGARNPHAVDWSTERSMSSVMSMLSDLLGIKKDPNMLHIKTHEQALPLYHGAYSKRLQGIEERLDRLPGLYLEANYKGGISIRDRVLRAEQVAQRILSTRFNPQSQPVSVVKPAPVTDFDPVTVTVGGVPR